MQEKHIFRHSLLSVHLFTAPGYTAGGTAAGEGVPPADITLITLLKLRAEYNIQLQEELEGRLKCCLRSQSQKLELSIDVRKKKNTET